MLIYWRTIDNPTGNQLSVFAPFLYSYDAKFTQKSPHTHACSVVNNLILKKLTIFIHSENIHWYIDSLIYIWIAMILNLYISNIVFLSKAVFYLFVQNCNFSSERHKSHTLCYYHNHRPYFFSCEARHLCCS